MLQQFALYGTAQQKYVFDVYYIGERIEKSNIIYVYADKRMTPIYIGMTIRTCDERYQEHDRDGTNHCASWHEAELILVHKPTLTGADVLYPESALKLIEADLIAAYKPPCNTLGK